MTPTQELTHTTPLRPGYLFRVRVYETDGFLPLVLCTTYEAEAPDEMPETEQEFPYLHDIAADLALTEATWIEHLPGDGGNIQDEFWLWEAKELDRATVEKLIGHPL